LSGDGSTESGVPAVVLIQQKPVGNLFVCGTCP
jgi:hypothetical protein